MLSCLLPTPGLPKHRDVSIVVHKSTRTRHVHVQKLCSCALMFILPLTITVDLKQQGSRKSTYLYQRACGNFALMVTSFLYCRKRNDGERKSKETHGLEPSRFCREQRPSRPVPGDGSQLRSRWQTRQCCRVDGNRWRQRRRRQ